MHETQLELEAFAMKFNDFINSYIETVATFPASNDFHLEDFHENFSSSTFQICQFLDKSKNPFSSGRNFSCQSRIMRKLQYFLNRSFSTRYCGRLWSILGAGLGSCNDRSLLQTTSTICGNDCNGWRRCWNRFILCNPERRRGVSGGHHKIDD